MSELKSSKTFDINEFLGWYNRGELVLSPKYQRNAVWNLNAKSYLIDTILNGLPIPPIFIRQKIDLELNKTIREVLDGQQRLRAIVEFKNNEFKILKSQSEDYGGYEFESLPDNLKEAFLTFELSVEIIKTDDEATIYDMFARLNSNNMTLNRQEIRNAKYWGVFKVFINRMAKKYKKLFLDLKTFNSTQLARMYDLELLSSLSVLSIDGIITETPSKIDAYYKKFDNLFEREEEIQKKMSTTLNFISKLFNEDSLRTNYFHRRVWFYTLYAFIYLQLYGLNNSNFERSTNLNTRNISNNLKRLKQAFNELESKLERFEDESLDAEEAITISRFFNLHKTRTTSHKERNERIKFLNDYICGIVDG